MKAVLDTNILIDYLNGRPEAATELERYDEASMSIVTWMEVMVGATPDTESTTREFLEAFDRIGIAQEVADRAVSIRREYRLKLLDALVWASADVNSLPLVTRNTKDFPDAPGIRFPYSI